MTQVQNDNTPYKRFVVTASVSVPNAATGTFNQFIDTDNTTKLKSSSGAVTTIGGAGGGSVSDDAYGAGWNGVTGTAPSQNAVYDKIESMGGGASVSNLPYDATSWNGVTGTAPSQDAVRDKFESLSAGGLVLLEQRTATATGSASLDFTTCISSTYDEYAIELVSIIPATNNANLYMRMSTDGGSTYDAGANYAWVVLIFRSGASAVAGAENSATFINLTNYGIANAAAYGYMDGSLKLFNPASASLHKRVGGACYFVDSSSYRVGVNIRGDYLSTTAVNAFRFLMSSGNITSGTIRVYGVAK